MSWYCILLIKLVVSGQSYEKNANLIVCEYGLWSQATLETLCIVFPIIITTFYRPSFK